MADEPDATVGPKPTSPPPPVTVESAAAVPTDVSAAKAAVY